MFKPLYGTGPDVVAPYAEFYEQHPAANIGSQYVGAISDFFFAGIFLHQLWYYFGHFPKDQAWIRRLVIVVAVLSIYKLVPSFYLVWDKNVIKFGDWMYMVVATWPGYLESTTSTLINLTTQTFFVWRCFTLTGRNWYLLAILGTMMLVDLGFAIAVGFVFAVDPFNDKLLWKIGIPMIGLALLVDITITATVTYKLLKNRRGFNKTTDSILTQILSITWEAAIPPALSHLSNAIVFGTMSAVNTWYIFGNMLTPRLYVFSLMFVLNSRVDVRAAVSSMGDSSREQRRPHDTLEAGAHSGSANRPSIALTSFKLSIAPSRAIIPGVVKAEDAACIEHNSPHLYSNDAIVRSCGEMVNEDNESIASSDWDREKVDALVTAPLG